jgi:hypothetical protein
MCKSLNIIKHISRSRYETPMIIWRCRKCLQQHSTFFHGKSCDELKIRRNVPQPNKGYIDKPIANTIQNGEKTENISSKVRYETKGFTFYAIIK